MLTLAANASQFKQELASASESLGGLEESIVKRIPVIGRLVDAFRVGAFGITASVAAIDAVTIKAAMDIQTPIQNLATVWDEAGQRVNGTFLSLADTTQEVINLSTQVPQSAASLAEALYNIASSGFQGTEAMNVLTASSKAASAGLTDGATSGRAITAVLNAYGLSASRATDVSDTMFQVVNRGVINFEELAQNMGDIAPIAASAGVSFADAGAALAAMTLSGLPAAEAATSLSGVMRGLIDPSVAMSVELEKVGYQSGMAALKAIGLQGVLEKLRISTKGNSDAWVQLFPDIRAARGAMAATANDGRILADVAGTITDSAQRVGATEAALAKQSESLSYQFQILHNTGTAIAATFGQTLLPSVKWLVDAVQTLVGGIADLPPSLIHAAAGAAQLLGLLSGIAALFITKWIAGMIVEKAIRMLVARLGEASIQARILQGTFNALAAVQMAMVGAMVGVTTGLYLVGKAAANAKEQARDLITELEKDIDLTTYQGTAEALDKIRAKGNDALDDWRKKGYDNPIKRMFAGTLEMITPLPNEVEDLSTSINELGKEQDNQAKRQAQYDQNINEFAKATGLTRSEVEKLAKTAGVDLYGGLNKTQDALRAARAEMTPAAQAAKRLEEDMAAVAKSIETTFGPMAAYQKAVQADTLAQTQLANAAKRAAETRNRDETAALERRLDNEQRQWEHSQELLQHQLEERQQLEDGAEDRRYQAVKDAEDRRYQLAKDEWDRQARAEKEALDRQHRTEKEALDDRLALLDQEYDQRKKQAQRLYEAQRDEIQFQIDSTFGAEREMWKQRLIGLEDSHDAELAAMDHQKDVEKRTQEDALDDQHKIQDDALSDDQKARQKALDEEHNRRQEGIDAEHKQIQAGIDLRHQIEKAGFDEDLRLRRQAFDDQQNVLRQHNQDLQRQRDEATETERQRAAAEHVITLGQVNSQLKERTGAFNQHTNDVTAIMARGGGDILAIVEKWPPQLVHALATAGPDMWNQVVEGIRHSAINIPPDTVGGPMATMFKNAAGFAAQGVLDGLAIKLASGELNPTQVQNALAKALYEAGPKYVPGRDAPIVVLPPDSPIDIRHPIHPADGGIFRFADGGEYHFAQIAPAGSWRLWAEPETGGEAYIPLARSKRARSASILGQVAEQFGYGLVAMANGGIVAGGGGSSSFTVNMPLSIEAHVAAGVDPDAVGRAVAVHAQRIVDEALDTLGRQVVMKAWRTR